MKISIYGAGGNGKIFLECIPKEDISVSYYIDEFSSEKEYKGIPIYRIKDIKDKSLPVFVSVSCLSTKIAEELREHGFTNVYDFNQSVNKLPLILQTFLPKMPWFSNSVKLIDEEKVSKLFNIITDKYSLDKVDQILNFRKNLDVKNYLKNDNLTQYFPEDIRLFENLNEPIRMIDCGAFTGDTLESVINQVNNNGLIFESVFLMEPDSKNIQAIHKKLPQIYTGGFCITVVPVGVWSENKVLNFNSNGASSKTVTCQSNLDNLNQVYVLSIDNMFLFAKPNFIKMDIEGAELEALKGASECIKKHTPVLAISIYHSPSDLWEIPLFIHSLNKNYEFYIRVHGDVGLETVLYCKPKPSGLYVK